jgi:hypothetical protein
MKEPTIHFPVTCPLCATEAITEYPVADVANALLSSGADLILYAPCHDYHWTANECERQQVRQYMGIWSKAFSAEPELRAGV